jgi:hypothetical protein
MPSTGLQWRHINIHTYGTWLPGDPRGWRSKDHKKHSSGDYKHRPPPGEHAGLYEYSQQVSGDPVTIPRQCRRPACMAIVNELNDKRHRVLIVAVGGQHAHALVELPDDIRKVRAIVGQCKSKSSHAIRAVLPGTVWAAGGKFLAVNDAQHHRNVYHYILNHIEEGAFVWSYREEVRLGPEYQKLWEQKEG